ncbi:Integral membrane protein [Klebsiella aerogenes]|nr:Integral membrane protein [Klebsiella aerogenes]
MTLTVFCILLFAALLHASWNAIVKASGDKMYAAIGVSGSAALIALVMLPFAPQPALVSTPYLLASCALQVVYTVLVAKTYQVSDMSQTYPLMRRHCAAAGGGDKRAVPRRFVCRRWPGWVSASSAWRFWRWPLTAAPARAKASCWR